VIFDDWGGGNEKWGKKFFILIDTFCPKSEKNEKKYKCILKLIYFISFLKIKT